MQTTNDQNAKERFTKIVAAVAECRAFPAKKELPRALCDLIARIVDQPLDSSERQTLAALLSGQLNRSGGRPRLTKTDKERRASLLADARKKRQELRDQGVDYHDASERAARWAADQPRNTEDRRWSTILRDMQSAEC